VDRLLEARVDREEFAVTYRGKPTSVRRYPISVDGRPRRAARHPRRTVPHGNPPAAQSPARARRGDRVERMDYTKGIEERLRAVERLLESEPQWMASSLHPDRRPTRIHMRNTDIRGAASATSRRASISGFRGHPSADHLLKIEHHQPDQIFEYYRGRRSVAWSRAHDGMNLVAKNSCRPRRRARRPDPQPLHRRPHASCPKLIVNPYDTDQCPRRCSSRSR